MAVDISQIAGAATDLLSLSASVSSVSAGSRRADPDGTPSIPPASEKEGVSAQESTPDNKAYLMDRQEFSQNTELAHNTSYSFERSDQDGKVYLSIKDKRTGQELYRVPKHYLSGIDPRLKPSHQVDIRI